jgi:hypothetical protein
MTTFSSNFSEPPEESTPSRVRIRIGLILTLIGLLIFLVGARPALFRLDRSHVVGFVQIAVFLIGMAIICLGGYISMMAYWRNGDRTIPAEIGTRLVTTGYLIAVFSGMADVFGFGTQLRPRVPFFGPWQATGVQLGEVVIAIGFLLLIPYRLPKKR